MLLGEVEKVVRSNLNVIRREVEKSYLCTLPVRVMLGGIDITPKDGYLYLSTDTLTKVVTDEGYKPYTTTQFQNLYGGEEPLRVKNSPFKVNCRGKEYTIGFKNGLKYLHLPDFIMSQLLYINSPVLTIVRNHVLHFHKREVVVYTHKYTVLTPYYVFKDEFDYFFDDADKLAELIGVFDVYKRGLMDKVDNNTLKLFFYPYVSLILYRDLRTTLYPHQIDKVVNDVVKRLGDKGRSVIEGYKENTLKRLSWLADNLKGKVILFKD